MSLDDDSKKGIGEERKKVDLPKSIITNNSNYNIINMNFHAKNFAQEFEVKNLQNVTKGEKNRENLFTF